MKYPKGRWTPALRSTHIAMAYLVVGVLWILFSDAAVEQLVAEPAAMNRVQTWKGWGFVIVTAAVLYFVMFRQFRRDRELLNLQLGQRAEIIRLSQFQKTVIDNANIWINVLDIKGRVLIWNKAAERITGYSSEEVIGRDWIWDVLFPDPDYRAWVFAQVRLILTGEQDVEGLETRVLTRGNGERLISWNTQSFRDADGQRAGSIALGLDITERRAAERRLRDRERQLTTIMDNLPGMAYRCLYDDLWTMQFVSKGCLELTGYLPAEVIDNRRVAWGEMMLPEYAEEAVEHVEQAIATASHYSLEYQLRRADGKVIWVWERGRAVEEDGGLVLEGIMLDISKSKELAARLGRMATMDPLTGLYNRGETQRLLAEEVLRAQRYERHLAVLWVDVDHFKQVNETLGHAVGDEVLEVVSQRLAESIRSVDTLGRFGGEEFLIVLPEMSVEEARDTAERLRHRIANEAVVTRAGKLLNLTISIGIAVYPDHANTPESLCDSADQAMYGAKQGGRNLTVIAGVAPAVT